jgi:hypothetical protein
MLPSASFLGNDEMEERKEAAGLLAIPQRISVTQRLAGAAQRGSKRRSRAIDKALRALWDP